MVILIDISGALVAVKQTVKNAKIVYCAIREQLNKEEIMKDKKPEDGITQCFVKIKEFTEKYLYERDEGKAGEYAMQIRAHAAMVSDLLKAKGLKK